MEQEMTWDDAEDSDDSQPAPKKKMKKELDAPMKKKKKKKKKEEGGEVQPKKRVDAAKKHWKERTDLSDAGREDLDYRLDPEGAAKRNKITGLGGKSPTWCPEIQHAGFVCCSRCAHCHARHSRPPDVAAFRPASSPGVRRTCPPAPIRATMSGRRSRSTSTAAG